MKKNPKYEHVDDGFPFMMAYHIKYAKVRRIVKGCYIWEVKATGDDKYYKDGFCYIMIRAGENQEMPDERDLEVVIDDCINTYLGE